MIVLVKTGFNIGSTFDLLLVLLENLELRREGAMMSRHQIKHSEKSNGLIFEIINEEYLQQENSVQFWNCLFSIMQRKRT